MRSTTSLVGACVLLLAGSVRAHVPHDVATILAISPDFPSDHTAFGAFSLIDLKVFGRSTDGGFEWQEIGTTMTHFGVTEFCFSPDFASDATAFAATTGGGVFRTQDRGLTWTCVGLDGLDVTDVAVSPAYAGNGLVLCTTTTGVFRSDDGGDEWTPITAGVVESSLTTVSFAPDDPTGLTVFAGSMTVHRSADGGLTWTALQSVPDRLIEIAFSPDYAVDGTLLAALRVGGVLRSNDHGATFTAANDGLTDLLTLDLDITPTGEVFVATRLAGVFRADAIGQPFAVHIAGIEVPDATTTSHYREVCVSPDFATDSTLLLASTEGVYVSIDGGFTWEQRDIFHQRIVPRLVISPDFVSDGRLYVADTGGGTYLWTERRDVAGGPRGAGPGSTVTTKVGAKPSPGSPVGPVGPGAGPPPSLVEGTWEVRSDELAILYPDSLAGSPDLAQDGTLFYGFTQVYRSSDHGDSWTKLTNPSALAREIAVSPNFANDRQVMIGSNGTGTFLSHDAGDTWVDASAGLPPTFRTRRVQFSPTYASDDTLYLASWDAGVFVSHDGAASFSAVNTGLFDPEIQSLAISPDFANDGSLLAGTRGNGLFRTLDGGATWTQVTAGFDLSEPIVVTGAAFSPDFAHDRTAFAVTLEGAIHRSTDGGDTWPRVGASFGFTAARDVVVSPGFAADGTLFVASHEGVWISRDRGGHFAHLPLWTRVDDSHYSIFPTGTWTSVPLSGVNGKGVSGSTSAGDARRFLFHGDHLEWHALAAHDAGIAEVWVDGVLEATLDLYAHSDKIVTAFTRDWDVPGLHEVRIVATGTANPFATDARVFDDGFTCSR